MKCFKRNLSKKTFFSRIFIFRPRRNILSRLLVPAARLHYYIHSQTLGAIIQKFIFSSLCFSQFFKCVFLSLSVCRVFFPPCYQQLMPFLCSWDSLRHTSLLSATITTKGATLMGLPKVGPSSGGLLQGSPLMACKSFCVRDIRASFWSLQNSFSHPF